MYVVIAMNPLITAFLTRQLHHPVPVQINNVSSRGPERGASACRKPICAMVGIYHVIITKATVSIPTDNSNLVSHRSIKEFMERYKCDRKNVSSINSVAPLAKSGLINL